MQYIFISSFKCERRALTVFVKERSVNLTGMQDTSCICILKLIKHTLNISVLCYILLPFYMKGIQLYKYQTSNDLLVGFFFERTMQVSTGEKYDS